MIEEASKLAAVDAFVPLSVPPARFRETPRLLTMAVTALMPSRDAVLTLALRPLHERRSVPLMEFVGVARV